jgi:predicted glycosyltransferase
MAALCGALAARGAHVVLASGGERPGGFVVPAGVEFLQLPPARAEDARFRALVRPDGAPVDEAWRADRRARVLRAFEEAAPDAVLVEHFPFGRRIMEFELLPLVEAARARRPRPLLACSVRDVLVARRDPARRAAMVARAAALFDRVLFHGDEALLPLAASLPEATALAPILAATGYVATPAPGHDAPGMDGEDEILVSAGGGAVGRRLLDCALEARLLSRERGRTWRVLAAATGLAPRREPGLVVEPNRPDFPALVARAWLSVSQAGYNTVVDVLAARARSVLVPFAAEGETEQSLRAAALAARGLATVVNEAELTPQMLSRAIDTTAAAPRPSHDIALDGAQEGARMILGWCAR